MSKSPAMIADPGSNCTCVAVTPLRRIAPSTRSSCSREAVWISSELMIDSMCGAGSRPRARIIAQESKGLARFPPASTR